MADILQSMISKLSLDADDFTKGIDRATGSTASFGSWMDKLAANLLSPAGAIGALTAIGAASFSAAEEFDRAADTIRIGTGATGEALKGLEDSFERVFGSVPATAEAVSSAIADLNTRLGITGKPLETLATQFVNLARLMRVDVASAIANGTRLFGDWSISTDKQSETLDYLFRVAQSTGISVDALMSTVVQFGAPMRALGFDIENAAALMGKWEKEGVNMETVLSGLRFALSKFAAAGKDPKEALEAVQRAILGAKTEADATAIAFDAFGKRAAVDLSRAIIEGRFSIDGMVKSLKASKESINAAAAATDDFGEKWKTTWNGLKLILVPLGNLLRWLLDFLVVEEIKAFKQAWDSLSATMGKVGDKAAWLAAKLGIIKLDQKKTEESTKSLTEAVKAAAPPIDDVGEKFEKAAEKTKRLKEEEKALKDEMDALAAVMERDRANFIYAAKARDDEKKALEASAKAAAELEREYIALTEAVSETGAAIADKAYKDAPAFLKQIDTSAADLAGAYYKLQDAAKQGRLSMSALTLASSVEVPKMKDHWKDFDKEVSTIVTNMVQGITNSLWDGKLSWKEKGLGALKELGKATTSLFIQPFTDAIAKFISGALADLIGGKGLGAVLGRLGAIGDSVGKVFGGGAEVASGAAGAAGAAGGAGGSAGQIAGSVASGLTGWINVISGAVTAISSVVGNFQMHGMNEKLFLIEESVRYLRLYVGGEGEGTVLGSLRSLVGLGDYLWAGMQRIEQETFKLFDIADLLTNIRDDMRANLYPQSAYAGGGDTFNISINGMNMGSTDAEALDLFKRGAQVLRLKGIRGNPGVRG